jgi:hypothetical protein
MIVMETKDMNARTLEFVEELQGGIAAARKATKEDGRGEEAMKTGLVYRDMYEQVLAERNQLLEKLEKEAKYRQKVEADCDNASAQRAELTARAEAAEKQVTVLRVALVELLALPALEKLRGPATSYARSALTQAEGALR